MSKCTCSVSGCPRPSRVRGWCDTHYRRWSKYGDPEYLHRLSCERCGCAFSSKSGNSKYCSASCRTYPDYIPPSRRGACSSCGAVVQVSDTSAAVPFCIECRRAGRAPSTAKHGTSRRYRNGCRCGGCVDSHNSRQREFRKSYSESRVCEECGAEFETRRDRPTRFCSVSCGNSQRRGSSYRERFVISDEDRLAVYERDGWVCQICSETVARDAHYLDDWAPTLDHVVPRSRGGSDGPENLRLAHRWCNSVIGDGSFYTDEDLRAVV